MVCDSLFHGAFLDGLGIIFDGWCKASWDGGALASWGTYLMENGIGLCCCRPEDGLCGCNDVIGCAAVTT